jgi:hypothetical protein
MSGEARLSESRAPVRALLVWIAPSILCFALAGILTRTVTTPIAAQPVVFSNAVYVLDDATRERSCHAKSGCDPFTSPEFVYRDDATPPYVQLKMPWTAEYVIVDGTAEPARFPDEYDVNEASAYSGSGPKVCIMDTKTSQGGQQFDTWDDISGAIVSNAGKWPAGILAPNAEQLDLPGREGSDSRPILINLAAFAGAGWAEGREIRCFLSKDASAVRKTFESRSIAFANLYNAPTASEVKSKPPAPVRASEYVAGVDGEWVGDLRSSGPGALASSGGYAVLPIYSAAQFDWDDLESAQVRDLLLIIIGTLIAFGSVFFVEAIRPLVDHLIAARES